MSRSNGVNSSYGYDNAGRLTNISHDGSGGNLLFTNYTLDANGNRTAVASNAGTESYTLDVLNRLTNATYPNGDTAAYSYDANGNRLSQTFNSVTTNYTYDDAGQLLSAGATSYSYDANGNLIAAGADSYTWDWANRLTSASVDGQTVNYAYDAMGVRVSATISGTTQNLLWDRMAELPLLVDDGNQSYLHGAGPLAQIDATGTRHDLLADGLGSVRNLIDGSGAVVGAADYSVFGEYRNQTGVTSRFGFTGEYYAQETGMWHLRARDLHPSLGRFLSADPVQPNAPGTQGYNRYAYVANNPTTWVDPSGYSVEDPFPEDTAILAGALAMASSVPGFGGAINSPFILLALTFKCALIEGCMDQASEANALIASLGSMGQNTYVYTVDALQNIFFSTYPHQPTPVDPGLLVLSIGLSNTPIIGDLYDLYTGVTGYDPITGQYLAGWERLANIAGALPFLGVSGANIRHSVHAAESLIDSGDELGQLIGTAGKSCSINSFSEETPVATDEGAIPIGEIDVGDRVLAWHEETGATGYYTVTAVWAHEDPVTVQLVVNGEVIETTPEHPFYEIDSAPWLATGATQGRWTPAGELKAGDQIRQADGTTGVVQTIVFEATPQVMYNLTVAEAHTYFVGNGEWLVHNCRRNTIDILFTQKYYSLAGNLPDGTRYRVVENVKRLKADPNFDLPPIEIFVKWPFMDEWGPMTHPKKGYTGDPVNLLNGHIYTLNNRRLITYIRADRDTIPVVWAKLEDIYKYRYEFDTLNWGVWITRRYNKR